MTDTPTNEDLLKVYTDNCPFVLPFLCPDIPTPDEPFDDDERAHWHIIGTDVRTAVNGPIALSAGWSVTKAKIAENAKYLTRALINGIKYPDGRVLPAIPGTFSLTDKGLAEGQMAVKLPTFDHAGQKFGGPYFIFDPANVGTFYAVEIMTVDSFKYVRIAGFYRHP